MSRKKRRWRIDWWQLAKFCAIAFVANWLMWFFIENAIKAQTGN